MPKNIPDSAKYPQGVKAVVCKKCGKVRRKEGAIFHVWEESSEEELKTILDAPYEHKLCSDCLGERYEESKASGDEVIEVDALRKKVLGARYFPGTGGEQSDLFGDE